MEQLSVIIVTYNSQNDIYDCISSIYKFNDIGNDLEIIVVDNHSADYCEMKEKLTTLYGDKITICQNSKNGGYGQGNNIGISKAKAPYIAIINPDVRLITPIFKEMIRSLQNPDIALVAGKQLRSDYKPFASYYSLLTLPWWFGRTLEFFSHAIFDHYFFKLEYLSGAFFAINKKIFEEIGLFDENIFMYAEENDIHYRLREKFPNKKAVYLKHIPYLHLAENRDFSPKRVRQVYLSNGYFHTKNNLSAINYWNGQIKLNKALIWWYKIARNNNFNKLRTELQARNNILSQLILDSGRK